MSDCTVLRHDQPEPFLCGAPATIPVRVGCMHEHVSDDWVCYRCYMYAQNFPAATWCSLCPEPRCCPIVVVAREPAKTVLNL